jgi:hypothetical protein
LVLPDPNVGCQPAAVPFWLGAAAIVLIFSFFGFFDSRLPFCSRLAIPSSLVRWQAITSGGNLGASLKRYGIQPRVSNDTRNRDALAIVAAFVRFNALKILFTPSLDFAIVFQRANVFV